MRIRDVILNKISGEWGVEDVDGTGIKVLRTTNFNNDGRLSFDNVVTRAISNQLVEKKRLLHGDVIIEKSGGSPIQPVGRVVFFDKNEENYLCNNFTTILRPSNKMFPRYFFYDLFYKYLSKRTLKYQNKTTGIINLQLERYLDEEIKLPALNEQRKIVKFLDTADCLRQKRKEQLALLDDYLKSVFLEMFSNPVRNSKSLNVCKVIDVCDCIVPGRDKPKSFSGNIAWITTDDLVFLGWTQNSKKKMGLTLNEIATVKAKIIPENSVVMTCVGDLGVVSIAKNEFVMNQQLHAFICSEKINNIFLMYNLFFQKSYMLRMASSTTVPYMNKTICNSVPILLPPIELQYKFASIVKQVEQTKQKMRASLDEMDNHFNALMQRYFG